MLAPRILPPLTPATTPYWTGGAHGDLLVERCRSCDRWQHPPTGACGSCGGAVEPQPVSGRGTVFTFTVNHQQYHPEVPPPYVLAVVELAEQTDLRLPTDIVDCDPDDVRIGAAVHVRFERHDEVFVPVFALDSTAGAGAA
ncbi:MAG: OB-fold domain-containing protein [Acidimicrobiales bacterium]|nr:OB-fold domain-containing protein [Acidimicrobiales bacterium]